MMLLIASSSVQSRLYSIETRDHGLVSLLPPLRLPFSRSNLLYNVSKSFSPHSEHKPLKETPPAEPVEPGTIPPRPTTTMNLSNPEKEKTTKVRIGLGQAELPLGKKEEGSGEEEKLHEEKKPPEEVVHPKHDHDPSSMPGASF